MEDKVYLDVDLKEHGIRVYLKTIQNLTGIPHWMTLKIIRSRKEIISHLCLSRRNEQWQLSVTYHRSVNRTYIKIKRCWKEVLE